FLANIEIKDIDLWLHIGTGRFILGTFGVPQVDILSCTIAGQPWINHEWLFQALVAFVYQWTGADGLINLQVGLVLINFVFLFSLGYSKERQFLPMLFLFFVLGVYSLRFTLRPDIFSLLFFTLYVYLLAVHLDKKWLTAVLLVIQIVWTNMHGFFILGP